MVATFRVRTLRHDEKPEGFRGGGAVPETRLSQKDQERPMSDKSFFAHSILPAVTGAIVRAAKVAGGAWVSWQNRRSIAALYAYDDRMLRDIGLTRHDLTSAMVSSPFGEIGRAHV